MTKYSTGEIAKLCGITIRTVQFYDSQGILIPSEVSEGGRRVYLEEDLKRMKIVCFLREIGLSIHNIRELLFGGDFSTVISTLLDQQEETLHTEMNELQKKLDLIKGIKGELTCVEKFSLEFIGDIAYAMENKKKMKKIQTILLVTGIPFSIIQVSTIVLWISTGIWWPFVVYLLLEIPFAVSVMRYYNKHVVYICPHCHEVFKPGWKELIVSRHTSFLRKLTCSGCKIKGFCIETIEGTT